MRKDAWEKTREEIIKERAEVLGRAGEALSEALSELDKIDHSIAEILRDSEERKDADFTEDVNREIQKYNLARQHAELRYYYLIVTREAMGFRRHKSVEDVYRIPPRKKYI